MPPILQNEGAWIALGISLFFLVAGEIMRRTIVKVLKDGEKPKLNHE